jgi:surface antigen
MRKWKPTLLAPCLAFAAVALSATALSGPAHARPAAFDSDAGRDDGSAEGSLQPYLQCVPYARQVSGIALYGDARTWWDQAEGRYARGTRPRVGAVMSFRPYGRMELGHVAAVSRIVDSRTVLLRHANWSIIDGRRGQIEDNVRAIDVSPENDWSEVRVWYAPLGDLGTTHWPVNGFIYNRKPEGDAGVTRLASAEAHSPRALAGKATPRSRIGADFLDGIVLKSRAAPARQATRREKAFQTPVRTASLAGDPIGRIIASRMR